MKISASITKNAFTGGNAGVSAKSQAVEYPQLPDLSSSDTEIEPLPEAPSTVTLTSTSPERKPAQVNTVPRSDGFDDLPSPTDLVLGGLNNGPLEDSLFDLSDDFDWSVDELLQHSNKTTNDREKSIHAMQQTEATTNIKRPLLSPDNFEPYSKQIKTSDKLGFLSGDIRTDSGAINTKAAEPTKGWDDIDPSLLDEFKDIVNFF